MPLLKLRGARGVQNSPLKIRGERGVIKERILISRGNVAGDSPNFRGLVKERPLILRWNLSKNTLLHKWM